MAVMDPMPMEMGGSYSQQPSPTLSALAQQKGLAARAKAQLLRARKARETAAMKAFMDTMVYSDTALMPGPGIIPQGEFESQGIRIPPPEDPRGRFIGYDRAKLERLIKSGMLNDLKAP